MEGKITKAEIEAAAAKRGQVILKVNGKWGFYRKNLGGAVDFHTVGTLKGLAIHYGLLEPKMQGDY